MKITKRQLQELIREAIIVPGDFINSRGETCIVGALAKGLLPSSAKPEEIYNLAMRLTKGVGAHPRPLVLANQGNIFGGLSALFENITADNDDVVDDVIRQELATYVEMFFPNQIEMGFLN